MKNCSRVTLSVFAAILMTALPTAHAATITIINGDDPGEGFNDPTPVAAVPGNPATTLGEQRLNVFYAAAAQWGSMLESNVEIRVLSFFDPMTCGVLGSSLSLFPSRDFPNAPFPQTWYQRPLGDALAGVDRHPGIPDLQLTYNSSYDDGTCAGGPWYYWISEPPVQPAPPASYLVLRPVVLHEMSHGLGFATYVDKTTGANLQGYTDIYSRFTYDETIGLHWNEMTDGQRAASAINDQQVVWDGPQAKIAADSFLTANNTNLDIATGPAAGTYATVGALYGGSWTATEGLVLPMEEVNDNTGTPNDACEPLVGFTPGRIAFIDRGTCEFGLKALHAEQAGAAGVIIANNIGGTVLVNMAPGEVGRQVTIPTIAATQNDGNTIRPNLPVEGALTVVDVHGMHARGFPTLYAPPVVELGSTISHFDVFAGPNALMEPAVNTDLFEDLDMTPGVFRDEGWTVRNQLIFEDAFESGDTLGWSSTWP